MTPRMRKRRSATEASAWVSGNIDALLIGASSRPALVAAMLLLRSIGRRIVANRDPTAPPGGR
jgi:glutamyl-tRNA reductase